MLMATIVTPKLLLLDEHTAALDPKTSEKVMTITNDIIACLLYTSRQLAETLKNTLPDSECIYYGLPDQQALEADLICIGFWTDKGCCDEALTAFLKTVHHKQIFLFGTAGFGRSDEYFSRILTNVTNLLEPDNTLVAVSYTHLVSTRTA